jgi:hypothetical protein
MYFRAEFGDPIGRWDAGYAYDFGYGAASQWCAKI